MGAASCTSLEVTGDDGALSGIYMLARDLGAYTRVDGGTTYIIGKYINGAFYLGEGTALYQAKETYPFYYVSQ